MQNKSFLEYSKIIMARFSRQITTSSRNIIIQFPEKNALIFSSNRNTKIITFQIPEKNLSNRNVQKTCFNFQDFIHENVDKRLQNKLKVYLPHLSRTPLVVDHNVFTLGRRHFILSDDEEKGSFRVHWSLTKISCCLCDKTF